MTEKQQAFLDFLFNEAKGDLNIAKRMAGYSNNVSTSTVVGPLKEEIAKLTKDYIANHGAKAAVKMVSVMDDPTQLGAKEMMVASKDVLDRGGFKPSDKVEVETKSPLFILPEKKSD